MQLNIYKLERNVLMVFLFVMFFILDAVFRIREYDEKGVDFQVALKFTLFVFGLLLGLRYVLVTGIFKFTSTCFGALILLMFYSFTSFYSPERMYSLYVSLTYMSYFIFIYYSLSVLGIQKVLSVLVGAIYLFLVISIYLYIFQPELGRFVFWNDGVLEPSWRMSGLAGSANNFARIISLGLMIVIFNWSFFKDKYPKIYINSFVFFSVVCILMSGSRTTILFSIFSMLVYFYLKLESRSKIYSLLVLAFGTLVAYISSDLVLNIISRNNSEDLSSFTGRDVIWDMSLELINDSFIWGYGLGSSVFLLPDLSDLLGFAPSHAHNMYLQLMLNGGFIGLCIFLTITAYNLIKLLKMKSYQFFSYLLFILLVGVFESGAFALSANIFTLVYFLCICVSNGVSNVYFMQKSKG